MPSIVSYAGLQDAVGDWLNRSDMGDVAPQLIRLAEDNLRLDPRVKRLVVDPEFTVDGGSVLLPDEFHSLESLALPEDQGGRELEIVSPGTVVAIRRQQGSAAAPRYAAMVDRRELLLAPVPQAEMDLQISYWETFPRLGEGGVLSNWLLERHSDIYLYATLVESAPYQREDERLQVWRLELEKRLEDLHKANNRMQYSGRLVQRPARMIP